MSEPLFEPDDRRLGIFDGVSTQLIRTRNHHDRNPKTACSFDLGVGRRSTRVFGDEHVDLLAREKRRFRLPVEWTATEQQPNIGRQRDIAGWINGAGDVVMMRPRGESTKVEAANHQTTTPSLPSHPLSPSTPHPHDPPSPAHPLL